jgi:CHAD domain-containing protein
VPGDNIKNTVMALDQDRVQKPFRKLRKIVKKLPKLPSPEQVHDLRTNSRKIEAAAAALMLDSRKNMRRLLRELKPVRRGGGKVRDLDVLTGFAATLRPEEDQDCLIELLEHLGAERHRQAKKLHGQVRRYGPKITRHLKQGTKLLKKLDESGGKAGKDSEWRADAASIALQFSGELRQWPALNTQNLHPFRKKAKELRYVLQMADNPDADLIESLGRTKDAIGEWHDWQELCAVAEKALDHGPGCQVMKLIKSNTNEKFERALAIANEMRKSYFQQAPPKSEHGSRAAAKRPEAVRGAIALAA